MTWQKGQSGNPNGRPTGYREKLTKSFVNDLADSWDMHGKSVLEKLAKSDPATYARIAATLVPRDIKIQHDVNMVADIIRLASQRSVEALDARNKKERVIEHVKETGDTDTLNLVSERIVSD